MVYFRIDDSAMTHDKIVALSADAFRLWVAAGCHSMGKLTDGFISEAVLRNVLHAKPKHVRELLTPTHGFESALWEKTPEGYRFHDWLDWQESAETIRKRREGARVRSRERRADSSRERSQPLTSPHHLEEGMNNLPSSSNAGAAASAPSSAHGGSAVDNLMAAVIGAVAESCRRDIDRDGASAVILFLDGRRGRSAGQRVKYPQSYYPKAIGTDWAEVQQYIDENDLAVNRQEIAL